MFFQLHPAFVSLLNANRERISWTQLARNPMAIDLLRENIDELDASDWHLLSANPAVSALLEHPDDMDWRVASENPTAIELLETYPDRIDWAAIGANINAMHLIRSHLDRVSWWALSANPAAMPLLEEHPERIDWGMLSKNPAAIDRIMAYPERIQLLKLGYNPAVDQMLEINQFDCLNTPDGRAHTRLLLWWVHVRKTTVGVVLHDEIDDVDLDDMALNGHLSEVIAMNQRCLDWNWISEHHTSINMLRKHLDKVSWQYLSRNPAAIELLQEYPEHIDWDQLSRNPAAIEMLEAHPERINWVGLSENPAAIHLLEAHPERIHWWEFCATAFSQYDYETIAATNGTINEAIIAEMFKPERLLKWMAHGGMPEDYL